MTCFGMFDLNVLPVRNPQLTVLVSDFSRVTMFKFHGHLLSQKFHRYLLVCFGFHS